jgi:hypothetical protein
LTGPRAIDTIQAMAGYEPKTRRFSRVEYEKLIELGFFQPGDPIELIGGELMVAEPQGAEHYTAIRRTARVLEDARVAPLAAPAASIPVAPLLP